MSNWCAEHKREKPCKICEGQRLISRKIMELPADERAALFSTTWLLPPSSEGE